jgi:hypothetical protein
MLDGFVFAIFGGGGNAGVAGSRGVAASGLLILRRRGPPILAVSPRSLYYVRWFRWWGQRWAVEARRVGFGAAVALAALGGCE